MAIWLVAGPLLAQSMRTNAAVMRQPPSTPYTEEFLPEGQLPGEIAAPGRYSEPPPPPYDYWQPTWMPCQTLRTNRSLVLGHLWFGMDIMGWSTKGVHAPPLLASGQTTLVGDEFWHDEFRPGGKLTLGWWFDPNQYSGLEFHYFELDGLDIDVVNDGANLSRPVLEPGTGANTAVPSTASGLLEGDVRILSNLQLTSSGMIFRKLFWASPYARFDYLVGYRHALLSDNLRVIENLVALDDIPGSFNEDDEIRRVDQFRAVNQFNGADLGLRGWWSPTGKLAVTSLAKVALGAANSEIIVNGFTEVDSGGSTTTSQGGVLALPSNIGSRGRQEFGVVSEVGLGLEWLPMCQVRLSLGYTWFYWSDVARAVAHVDRTVDTDQLAPTSGSGNRPSLDLQTTSFWAQGLNAGFVYEF